jgi:hypothetical protein
MMTDNILPDEMKLAPLVVLAFAASAIAVPAAAPEPEADALTLDISHELDNRQLPTQAGCYTACDKGPAAMRRYCRLLPVPPWKIACTAVLKILNTPAGKKRCRELCNFFL